MRRDWLLESGADVDPDDLIITTETAKATEVLSPALAEKQVLPTSVKSKLRATPFIQPVLGTAAAPARKASRARSGWAIPMQGSGITST